MEQVMKTHFRIGLVTALLVSGLSANLRGDIVTYDLRGHPAFRPATAGLSHELGAKDMRVMFEGTAVVSPLPRFTHPNGAQMLFKFGEVEIRKAPMPREVFGRQFTAA